MTKARDISSLIGSSGQIDNTKITLDANEIPNLDTAKITTGTFADARISNSSVSQHATSFDDNKLVNDISTLALRQASDQNKSAYNTNSQFVDVFQDATGLGTILNASRNASEYIYSKSTTLVTPTITHDADETGVDGDYTWYKWTDTSGTGSFSTNTATTAEWLVVAGGGAGGGDSLGGSVGGSRGVGGGGAGGLRTSYGSTSGGGTSAEANLSLGAGTSYTITVGAGGAGVLGTSGNDGSDSSLSGTDISTITATGGGAATSTTAGGNSGGSGGGGSNGASGGSGTANQGFAGGTGTKATDQGAGGGGGGAGSAGSNATTNYTDGGGAGGDGLSVSITGSAVIYAAGGGGARNSTGGNNGGSSGVGGDGGSVSNGEPGTANTGSGGGGAGGVTSSGSFSGGDGGSGVVILRVPNQVSSLIYNATGSFESNAITASSSTSSMGAIITYQDNAGTNALNTDIVLQLSADGGSNYSTATLTALPDFSTGIKMAKVNDLAVTAGTSLKYKISFANQAEGSKEARIRGVALQY